MRNQPRDVTGGEQMLANIVPGLGLMNYILGWFTVPIEVFLRRDFGERYFTKANFFAGLIVLLLIRLLAGLGSVFNPIRIFSSSSDTPEPESWMPSIIKYYIILSIAHFLYAWWKDIMGKPSHSFSSGRSWLRPVGKIVMKVLNLALDNLVRILFNFMPNIDPDRKKRALPVLRDVDVFTERFIEPLAVFILALYCQSQGQTATFFWLFFSVMALNFATGARHEAERAYVLDLRDQIYDMNIMNQILRGEDPPGSERVERVVRETAREAERSPEIVNIIRGKNPTLADAIGAISPNLKTSMTGGNSVPNSPTYNENGGTTQI